MMWPRLPDSFEIRQSERMMQDSFFPLPRIVETFIGRANKELPYRFVARPQTIFRAVTIFLPNRIDALASVSYADIEDDIVHMLDYVVILAQGYHARSTLTASAHTFPDPASWGLEVPPGMVEVRPPRPHG